MRELSREEAVLLRKLYQGRRFGGSHLLEANLLRGIPRNRARDFRDALRALKRDGIVHAKPTVHGPAVSIPPELSHAIVDGLRKFYPDLVG